MVIFLREYSKFRDQEVLIMCFKMDTVRFIVLFLITKKFANASFVLSSSPDKATSGFDFTFSCRTNAAYLFFTRDDINECTIVGGYPNGTCKFGGSYNKQYTYACDNTTGVYNLTIPHTFNMDSLQGSLWKCRSTSGSNTSGIIRLYIFVPITQVILTTIPTDKSPIEIISGNIQMFKCETNAGRPSSRIQWYIAGTNMTGSATPQVDVCMSDCNGKVISSSELTYTGNISENGNMIYCTAGNINGQSIRSNNKSIAIWYPPSPPSLTQIPEGSVNENDQITLTCEIVGGNPLGNIIWQCNEIAPIITTGSPPTNKTVSTIQLNATKSLNGEVCTCIGSHPAWMENKSSNLTLKIRYAPTVEPTITQSPSEHAIEGKKVTLTCEISGGNPLATIGWQCEDFTQVIPTGTPPTNKVVSSVERIVTRLDDGKECVCTGYHPLWTNDKEFKYQVHVYYPPASQSITQIPEGSVDEYEQIKLTCKIVGGNPLATIFWICDGSSTVYPTENPPTNTTMSSIQLNATRSHNGKVCRCIGSHPSWMANNSLSITLQIRYAPDFSPTVIQTPSEPAIEGQKVTLACEILGGNPLATIGWQCKDFTTVIQPDNPPTDKIISSVARNVTRLDDGKECVCTGQHPLWSKDRDVKHQIIVYYSAAIEISNTETIIVVENKTLDLVCKQVDGNPKNASFTWYKSGSIICNAANYSVVEATANDAGGYTCRGSNGFGNESVATIEVDVLYAPRISTLSVLDGNIIAENGTAVLQCIVQSNPLPSIVWMKEGSDKVLNRKDNALQSNLTIGNADCLHTSNYSCKATNLINNNNYITLKRVELFVNCSPRRYDRQEESANLIGLEVGQNLTLLEHILAYPKGNVTWTFSQDLNSSDTKLASASLCSTNNIFEHHICFVRLNLTETDFGLYSAIVTNDIGTATFRSIVKPQGKPDPPKNVTCTGRPYSVLLHWKSSFNGGDTQIFQIYLKKNGHANFDKYGKHYNDPGRNVYSEVEIVQLTPGTIYQFKVRASNNYNFTLSDLTSCNTTIAVEDNLQNTGSIVIAAATGISAGVIVLILIAVIFIFIRRRTRNGLPDQDKEPMQRSATSEEDNDDDGLKENPLYVSSPQEADGAIYSIVDKHRQNQNNGKGQLSNDSSVYTEVVKTNKKDIKIKEIEMGYIQQNSADVNKEQTDAVYANSELKSKVGQNYVYRPTKNKDGLIYADLDLAPMTKGQRFVIRGLENRNQYAVIDLTKNAEPLSSDSDSEDDITKKKIVDE